MNHKAEKNPYQDTLNLPKTTFPIRAHAHEKEPEIARYWKEYKVASRAVLNHHGRKQFLLHDGPPYSNGNIHIGHALNKTLKDVVTKSKRMAGYYVPFVRGWDCHGLPIELKVQAERDPSRSFKEQCRAYAEKWIATQAEQFDDLGFFSDERYYTTMSYGYEADILRALAGFVDGGYIHRKGKAVPWCASCRTVLALAEIEYQDRKDPACYVRFSLDDVDAKMLFPLVFEQDHVTVSLLAWTTTPWTLPLNRAIMLNPDAEYVMLKEVGTEHAIIVARARAGKLMETTGKQLEELCYIDADVFDGKRVRHPLVDGATVPVILDAAVAIDEGTAVLHTAPGCGPEDYQLGLKHGLEIYSPISSDGKYTEGIMPQDLEGVPVADGQFIVLKQLSAADKLFFKESIKHSYPHCWRCHEGLIFRATDQWFCDLQKNKLVDRALEEIEKITFIPTWGKPRLQAFVGNRTEWCISRQREWGVPIPALRCNRCLWTFMTGDFIRGVADQVAREGIEFWDRVTLEDLINLSLLPKDFACQHCGNHDLAEFTREKDILDVWFDSGVSHYAVLKEEYGLSFPADLYLEGSDQHRGWFQSSLLCSTVLFDQSPYKSLLTHGYVLDEHKRKMSKSIGNVVAPEDVVKKYSRDILRLWAVTVDSEQDVVISERLLENVAEVYRKIRNTCRFLISNLYDFNAEADSVALSSMHLVDQYALARLYEMNTLVQKLYEQYDFAGVVQTMNNYCIKDLSALYLDLVKDRLYCDGRDARGRRSAQTACHAILDVITRLLAPIISFTAEEIAIAGLGYSAGKSIHLEEFSPSYPIWDLCQPMHYDARILLQEPPVSNLTYAVTIQRFWELLEVVREIVLKGIEVQRENGSVKHSLEAALVFSVPADCELMNLASLVFPHDKISALTSLMKEWMIVSSVSMQADASGLQDSELPWLRYRVAPAGGVKCPRCWQWTSTQHEAQVCDRCAAVIEVQPT